MTRLEKVRVLKERHGFLSVMGLVDWLLDAKIDHLRRIDSPRGRRSTLPIGPQPNVLEKQEK